MLARESSTFDCVCMYMLVAQAELINYSLRRRALTGKDYTMDA